MSYNLLPCPFCGSDSHLEVWLREVSCENCGARGPIVYEDSSKEAAYVWCRRAGPPSPPSSAMREALEKIVAMDRRKFGPPADDDWAVSSMIMEMRDIARSALSADDGHAFKRGALVEKTGGDYCFPGTVLTAFTKLSGQVRYVVEDDRGVVHIFNEAQLKTRALSADDEWVMVDEEHPCPCDLRRGDEILTAQTVYAQWDDDTISTTFSDAVKPAQVTAYRRAQKPSPEQKE